MPNIYNALKNNYCTFETCRVPTFSELKRGTLTVDCGSVDSTLKGTLATVVEDPALVLQRKLGSFDGTSHDPALERLQRQYVESRSRGEQSRVMVGDFLQTKAELLEVYCNKTVSNLHLQHIPKGFARARARARARKRLLDLKHASAPAENGPYLLKATEGLPINALVLFLDNLSHLGFLESMQETVKVSPSSVSRLSCSFHPPTELDAAPHLLLPLSCLTLVSLLLCSHGKVVGEGVCALRHCW